MRTRPVTIVAVVALLAVADVLMTRPASAQTPCLIDIDSGVPTIYDNAGAGGAAVSAGQTFTAIGSTFLGVGIFINDPTRPGVPAVGPLVGPAEMFLLDVTDITTPFELARQEVVAAGGTLSGPVTLLFSTRVTTEPGRRYYVGFHTASPYGLGLTNQYTSTYEGGAQTTHDTATGSLGESPTGRDVAFHVYADCSVGPDSDQDGVVDTRDNCPTTENPDQGDHDGDGQGDVCDLDDDNDGVNDTVDNCPVDANSDQTDDDRDGLGNACDPEFSNNAASAAIQSDAALAVSNLTTANPPGVNGLVAKLSGNGSIPKKVADAVAAFDGGAISAATFDALLDVALSELDGFDAQVAAKIAQGKITEPQASAIRALSASLRAVINGMKLSS